MHRRRTCRKVLAILSPPGTQKAGGCAINQPPRENKWRRPASCQNRTAPPLASPRGHGAPLAGWGLPAGLQQARSIAQVQHCAGVLAQSIREIAPPGFLPVKDFLLIPSERPIGVKNIRRLARKPCRKALRAKAKSPGKLKRS
jgi:hypothetical protein